MVEVDSNRDQRKHERENHSFVAKLCEKGKRNRETHLLLSEEKNKKE